MIKHVLIIYHRISQAFLASAPGCEGLQQQPISEATIVGNLPIADLFYKRLLHFGVGSEALAAENTAFMDQLAGFKNAHIVTAVLEFFPLEISSIPTAVYAMDEAFRARPTRSSPQRVQRQILKAFQLFQIWRLSLCHSPGAGG